MIGLFFHMDQNLNIVNKTWDTKPHKIFLKCDFIFSYFLKCIVVFFPSMDKNGLKGRVYPKMNILSLSTHPCAVG